MERTVTVHRMGVKPYRKEISEEQQKEIDKVIKFPLTNKQKKVRVRNKIAKKSRKINRK